MIEMEKHGVYIIVGIIVVIVLLGFSFLWYTKKTVKDELKKLTRGEKKKRPIKHVKREQPTQRQQQQQPQDVDSYIDPGDEPDNT